MYEKLVVVTRRTRLQELVARFNTRMQAKFYIEHSGGDFSEYEEEDRAYEAALSEIRRQTRIGLKVQFIDRTLLPTYTFLKTDIVIVLGQDGVVANTAKYAGEQPIIGVNPDPIRYDGVLVPVLPFQLGKLLSETMESREQRSIVTLASVELQDGQRLLAFNDLFIGAKTHVSARYRMRYHDKTEFQSSSGVVVSTGVGSTGWLSSMFNMASSVSQLAGSRTAARMDSTRTNSTRVSSGRINLRWDDPSLIFVVREPFISKHSSADIVAGFIEDGDELVIESTMTGDGTIFSDGVESDFIAFNAGSTARIRKAKQHAVLVMPSAIARTEAGAA